MKDFFKIWITGYYNPGRSFQLLKDKTSPLYGLAAILLRGAVISLAWMLPRALMGIKSPGTPVFPFLTPENYYWHAMWIYPVFELSRWLLQCALIYLALRLAGKKCGFDSILNIAGMISITIEPAVRLWDWIAFLAGWSGNLVFMGISHALLAWPWSLVLIAIAYKKVLNVPPLWSVALGFLASLLIIPLAALFLRP